MRFAKPFVVSLLLFTLVFGAQAQEDGGFTSTVNWLYSACEDRMVVDFSGTMELGYDLYFQAFDAFGGLGEAITGLRRISVNGDYSVSQVIYWLNGQTRPLNTPISVVIRIGRENDPDKYLVPGAFGRHIGRLRRAGQQSRRRYRHISGARARFVFRRVHAQRKHAESDLFAAQRAYCADWRAT